MKFGIISTFDELCGNASYSEKIALAMEARGIYVSRLSLDQNIFRNPAYLPEARRSIDQIGRSLHEYDCINIQLELGLFGCGLEEQMRNILRLIKLSPKLTITLHRLEPPVKTYKTLFRPKRFIKTLSRDARSSRFHHVFKRIINFANSRNANFIVHHRLAKLQLCSYPFNVPSTSVIDCPISFLTADEQKTLSASNVIPSCMLPGLKIVRLGLNGFVSRNKGHLKAFEALKELPEYYHLFILGAAHPREKNTTYTEELLSLRQKLALESRVHFCGRAYSDHEYYERMASCNVLIFPYLETGLMGSGNLALARDLRKTIALSNIEAFTENQLYYKDDDVAWFDPNNPSELAHSIASLQSVRQITNNPYNIDSVVDAMLGY